MIFLCLTDYFVTFANKINKQNNSMRQRTADWFETKIRYDKTMDDGMLKPITEQYVVDALSFTEAENAIIEEMSAFIAGDFAPYHEVFFSENDNDDKWYKAKLQFITLDEKTEKEKRSNVNYLVQASSLQGAVKHIDSVMGNTMITYDIASVTETPIMDVYEHVATTAKAAANDKPEYEEDPKSTEEAE